MNDSFRNEVDVGRFPSAVAVVEAGLQRMMAEDFAPGELQRLVDEGEESIRREGTLTLDEVIATGQTIDV